MPRRVVLGAIGGAGNFGMKIAPPGFDADTAFDTQLVFNSQWAQYGVVHMSGILTPASPVASFPDLGYTPLVAVVPMIGNTQQNPYFIDTPSNFGGTARICYPIVAVNRNSIRLVTDPAMRSDVGVRFIVFGVEVSDVNTDAGSGVSPPPPPPPPLPPPPPPPPAADSTPDPINFTDFSEFDLGFTNAVVISGINQTITLTFTLSGTSNVITSAFNVTFSVIRNGVTAATTANVSSGSSLNVQVNNGDTLVVRFTCQTAGNAPTRISGTCTVRNFSDGNAVLDTFTYQVTASN